MKYFSFFFVGTPSEEDSFFLNKGRDYTLSIFGTTQNPSSSCEPLSDLDARLSKERYLQQEGQVRKSLSIQGYSSIAQVIYLSGEINAPPLCSGISLCGRCRVCVKEKAPSPHDADLAFFTPKEIEEGWRLGCRHTPVVGMLVNVPLYTSPIKRRNKKCFFPDESDEANENQGSKGTAKIRNKRTPALTQIGKKEQNSALSLAIDLGTTSLHWMFAPSQKAEPHAIIDKDYSLLASRPDPFTFSNTLPLPAGGSETNPQMGAGSDVISRLAVARTPSGRNRLSNLVVKTIKNIIEEAEDEGFTIEDLCLAANPAMTAIALDKEVKGLVAAPYFLPLQGGSWESISSLPPLWVPPQLSPFVGGDISAGYAAIALASTQEKACFAHTMLPDLLKEVTFPFLLADMGTNGEFVLALTPEKAFTASVALGPALEGIGLLCGTEARHGAVTSFGISPLGLQAEIYTDENPSGKKETMPLLNVGKADTLASCFATPQTSSVQDTFVCGITGTGYLSLLRRLLASGAISREGQFTGRGMLSRYFAQLKQKTEGARADNDTLQRKGRSLPDKCLRGEEPYLPLPHKLFLTATDVEELLKVKAAFSLGLTRLLDTAGVSFSELTSVYLAGALGEHIDTIALEDTGFLPRGAGSRVRVAGNTSLIGSALLISNEALRTKVIEWATKVTPLDLAQDAIFLEQFSSHMSFRWNV